MASQSAVIGCLLVTATTLLNGPAFAQVDISGEWAVRIHEDQPHRVPGPSIGEHTMYPEYQRTLRELLAKLPKAAGR